MKKETMELLNLRRLPARLNVEQAAAVLGFAPHDIPELVKAKLLKPLGSPGQNSVKYFLAKLLEEQVNDQSWLDKATKTICQRWLKKNSKRKDGLGIPEITEATT